MNACVCVSARECSLVFVFVFLGSLRAHVCRVQRVDETRQEEEEEEEEEERARREEIEGAPITRHPKFTHVPRAPKKAL